MATTEPGHKIRWKSISFNFVELRLPSGNFIRLIKDIDESIRLSAHSDRVGTKTSRAANVKRNVWNTQMTTTKREKFFGSLLLRKVMVARDTAYVSVRVLSSTALMMVHRSTISLQKLIKTNYYIIY